MKVLVLSEEGEQRSFLQGVLEEMGQEIVAARDGEEALKLAQSQKFSIVIADEIEFVRKIRRMQNIDSAYIILISDRTDQASMSAIMEDGADDWIPKPLESHKLIASLKGAMRILRLEQQIQIQNQKLEGADRLIRQELELACKIQDSLLPHPNLRSESFYITWRFRPYQELAGDTFNFFRLDERTLGLYVLDVNGHGAPAALLAVALNRMLSPNTNRSNLLREVSAEKKNYRISPPTEVAEALNRQFQIDESNPHFFTLIYGILDTWTGELRFVNAGHPGLIYLPGQRNAQLLEIPSYPIGFTARPGYEEQKLTLRPGDRFFLFSDGIIEVPDSEERLFGSARILESLEATRAMNLEESLDELLGRIEYWSGKSSYNDDVTLLALESMA